MDEQLKRLIKAACQHPEGSLEWRLAMHRLLIKLQQLPGIRKSNHPDYLEALNQTFGWVSRNICKEFVSRGSLQVSLVNWINGYLYWRIHDLYSSNANDSVSLDMQVGSERKIAFIDQISQTNITTPTLSGLDEHIDKLQRQKIRRIAMALEDYIEQDPDKKLLSCHPRNCPQCNCQLLSQRRYIQIPSSTFKDIAKELNMSQMKVTNHWYGRCRALLQEIALDLGYQPRQNDE